MRTELPVLDCSNCGACCTHVGTPPGFAGFFPRAGHAVPEHWKTWPDYRTLAAAPERVRAELAAYYAALDRGETADRCRDELPCLWYDPAARTCRHHAHRPQVCREFEVGGEDCLRARNKKG